MSNSKIKKNLQGWYDAAVWYGYAKTEIGEIREYEIFELAKKLKVELIYPTCI